MAKEQTDEHVSEDVPTRSSSRPRRRSPWLSRHSGEREEHAKAFQKSLKSQEESRQIKTSSPSSTSTALKSTVASSSTTTTSSQPSTTRTPATSKKEEFPEDAFEEDKHLKETLR